MYVHYVCEDNVRTYIMFAMIMLFMLQDEEKTAPESARKEADMSDNESAGLYYGGPSDEVCRVLEIVTECSTVRT